MKVEQLYGPKVKSFQVLELEYLLQEDSPELFFSFGLKKRRADNCYARTSKT